MVKHIILWNLKDEYSDAEKEEIKKNIKKELEALKEKISDIIDIKVYTKGIFSSSVDVMLDSTFANEQALKNYAENPDHVKAADTFVRPYVAVRSCMDYEV